MKTSKINYKNIGYAVFAAAYTAAFALLAGALTDTGTEWYMTLEKGPLMPPGPVFAAAWPAIYTLLAVAFASVLIKSGGKSGLPFMLNAAAPALWCYVFFVKHHAAAAFILITVLTAGSAFLFGYAARKSRAASYFTLPFAVWMGFASALNYHIVLLN